MIELTVGQYAILCALAGCGVSALLVIAGMGAQLARAELAVWRARRRGVRP